MRTTAKTTAALWGTAGSAWVANGALGLDAADRTGGFYLSETVWLIVHGLVLAGLVGLGRLGVTGHSRWGKAGLGLAIIGRILFLTAEVVAITQGNDDNPLFPPAALTTVLGMLVTGASIITAHRMKGWQRYLPLTVGAYPLIFMFPILAITGERPDLGLTGWGLTLLGVAIALRTATVQEPPRSATSEPTDRSIPRNSRQATGTATATDLPDPADHVLHHPASRQPSR